MGLYIGGMNPVIQSQLRSSDRDYVAAAQYEPVEVTSPGAEQRAFLVSAEFFHRAMEALEDEADIRAVEQVRHEPTISHAQLKAELGL